jgi:hypothetical protein
MKLRRLAEYLGLRRRRMVVVSEQPAKPSRSQRCVVARPMYGFRCVACDAVLTATPPLESATCHCGQTHTVLYEARV